MLLGGEVLYCPLFMRLPCFLSNLGPFISWDVFLHPAQNSPVLVHPGVFSLFFLPSVQPWIHMDTLLPALFVVSLPTWFPTWLLWFGSFYLVYYPVLVTSLRTQTVSCMFLFAPPPCHSMLMTGNSLFLVSVNELSSKFIWSLIVKELLGSEFWECTLFLISFLINKKTWCGTHMLFLLFFFPSSFFF